MILIQNIFKLLENDTWWPIIEILSVALDFCGIENWKDKAFLDNEFSPFRQQV